MITIRILGLENEAHEVKTDFTKRVGMLEIIELTSSKPLTVKEAMSVYCKKYGSRIEPYDGSDKDLPLLNGEKKYFFYYDKHDCRHITDIHIEKQNGDNICIKQDLSYLLEDGDTLSFGKLIC